MSLTIAAISGVVSAAVKYLLVSKGLETAAQKATEKIGELGGEALVNVGKNALLKLRDALAQRGDAAKKAQKALDDVEDDPTDEDYQRKFATELDKLAANDGHVRALLEQLSAEVEKTKGAGSGRSHTQTISGHAQIGTNVVGDLHGNLTTGPITFGDQIDARNSQGMINQPSGSVNQNVGEQRNVDTGGGDYTEGDVDQRQGAFVEGGTVSGPVVGTNSGSVSSSSDDAHTGGTQD